MSVSNINPGEIFGGTWQSVGAGRTLIGVDPNDTDFNAAEKVGGAKTVSLSHSHTVNNHTHTTEGHALTVNEIPSHSHYIGTRGAISWPNTGNAEFSFGAWEPNAYPYVEQVEYTGSQGGGASHSHGNTGGSSPGTNSQLSSDQSILQPYVTCYMWKRTA